MSLYAVKNDEGKWLGCEIYCDEPDWFDHGGFIWDIRSIAEENVKLYGGHVVELADDREKIAVSEEEAEMLTEAKTATYPAEYITRHSCLKQGSEDRLMRAYVNGYTVAKEKKYNVKVPLVQAQGGLWFLINSSGKLDATYIQDIAKKFSRKEINTWGLQDCEKEEATDDEQ